ncbi:MAG: hypothetical protein ACHQJX_06495 [Candidatus Acidiferrales bacterium]|jgi:hypothetical protein|nr:hypothetical protein [Candidatus Acidoferrales bacterium]
MKIVRAAPSTGRPAVAGGATNELPVKFMRRAKPELEPWPPLDDVPVMETLPLPPECAETPEPA